MPKTLNWWLVKILYLKKNGKNFFINSSINLATFRALIHLYYSDINSSLSRLCLVTEKKIQKNLIDFTKFEITLPPEKVLTLIIFFNSKSRILNKHKNQ